ncbi:MAG: methyltransferase domain-containing protein, partial [Thermodesulfobacteriota bacterium]
MAEHDGYLATGFRDVDGNSNIGKLEACLRFMERLPSFKAYKKVSIERLRLKPGDRAVDLGCGLGFDVDKLANIVCPDGSSVGIDNSQKLLDAAGRAFGDREGVSFMRGDIHDLEIPDNSVDGIRVDRTLQHIQDPQRVISEMVRV